MKRSLVIHPTATGGVVDAAEGVVLPEHVWVVADAMDGTEALRFAGALVHAAVERGAGVWVGLLVGETAGEEAESLRRRFIDLGAEQVAVAAELSRLREQLPGPAAAQICLLVGDATIRVVRGGTHIMIRVPSQHPRELPVARALETWATITLGSAREGFAKQLLVRRLGEP